MVCLVCNTPEKKVIISGVFFYTSFHIIQLYRHVDISTYQSIHLSIYQSIYVSIYLMTASSWTTLPLNSFFSCSHLYPSIYLPDFGLQLNHPAVELVLLLFSSLSIYLSINRSIYDSAEDAHGRPPTLYSCFKSKPLFNTSDIFTVKVVYFFFNEKLLIIYLSINLSRLPGYRILELLLLPVSIRLSIRLSIYLSTWWWPSAELSCPRTPPASCALSLSVYLSNYLSIYPPHYPSMYKYLCIYLPDDGLQLSYPVLELLPLLLPVSSLDE